MTTELAARWAAAGRPLLILTLVALAPGAGLWAQKRGPMIAPPIIESALPSPATPLANSITADLVAPAAPESYLIGANDLLSVFVYQMPEMTRQVRVSASGLIRVPFAAKLFRAEGKTSRELQRAIAADLQAEGLVRRPVVQVTVTQVESKPIVIAGAVLRPAVVQAARPMHLLEVLARADGLADNAGDTVVVTTYDSGKAVAHSYDLNQLIHHNNQADNPLLDGRAMVTVLPAQKVYVVGDFRQPGAFPLAMGQPITVLNAIALAHGLDATPDKSHAIIIKTLADGTRQQIPVPIDKILKHHAPNPQLQAGDILYVSKDVKRQVLLAALNDAAQLVTLGFAYNFPIHK